MEETKGIDIPRAYTVVSDTSRFLDQLVSKNWTERQLRDYLESFAFRKETVERLVKAVNLRKKEGFKDTGEYPTDDKGNHLRPKRKQKPRPEASPEQSMKKETNQVKQTENESVAKHAIEGSDEQIHSFDERMKEKA